MKKILVVLLIMLISETGFGQTASVPAPAKASPAERSIAQANKLIEKNPKNFEAYNALALGLSRRARETSDVSYYTQAEDALQKSFAISPSNFDGERTHVWLLLGKHEFTAALEEAKKLNKRMPDDVMTYGFLTDANVELGNYKDAEVAAQWMLDLRPGNLPGLTRGAYLRELFGDIDGAVELMDMAFQSTPPSEAEDGTWILTQLAHLKLSVGKAEEAEKLLAQALKMFPGYHYALGNLAKVRILEKRYDEATELLKERYQAAPHAENLYDLAKVLELAGQTDEAKKAFTEFERKSLLETNRADNSNRELIFYYADDTHEPAKALEVAKRESARRRDVYTLDSYAWALYCNGQYKEARKHMHIALEPGIQDAKLFFHAGEIALKNGDPVDAEHYLRLSANLNTLGSDEAKVALADLSQTAIRH